MLILGDFVALARRLSKDENSRYSNPKNTLWAFQQCGTPVARSTFRELSMAGCRPSKMAVTISGAKNLSRASLAR